VRLPLFDLLYQPWMIDDNDDECGAVGGMSGRENISPGESLSSATLSSTNLT
jgi:hypothetical protein